MTKLTQKSLLDRFFKTLKFSNSIQYTGIVHVLVLVYIVQSLNPQSMKLYRPNSEIPHIPYIV